jgi:osmotically-inducible protein OsmY
VQISKQFAHLSEIDQPADAEISLAIETELAYDQSVDADDLQVTTVEGVVTLGGQVTNLLEAQRAVEIARATKGVRSVVDEIAVQPLARPDSEIRDDLTAALLVDPAVESYELNVDVDGGVVSLSGAVESWTERYLAGEIAMGIRGVKRVDNDITDAPIGRIGR